MSPVVVIAEAGVNHQGSLRHALEMIDCARDSGADVIKFQTFKAEALVTASAPSAEYQVKNAGAGVSQKEMLQSLEFSEDDWRKLQTRCREVGIEFLSSPFDLDSVELLRGMGVARLKIASGEITNAPLLVKVAHSGLPLILSTGMSTMAEVAEALQVLSFAYTQSPKTFDVDPSALVSHRTNTPLLQNYVTLLHCVSEYPAPSAEQNLRAISTMRSAFGLPVGFSDHTTGLLTGAIAVACGAPVLEKHFTLDKNQPGPDHAASLEPDELGKYIAHVRECEILLGQSEKKVSEVERKNIVIGRRSLVAIRTIEQGETFDHDNLGIKRPGHGIAPSKYWSLIGRPASRCYDADEMISEELDA